MAVHGDKEGKLSLLLSISPNHEGHVAGRVKAIDGPLLPQPCLVGAESSTIARLARQQYLGTHQAPPIGQQAEINVQVSRPPLFPTFVE